MGIPVVRVARARLARALPDVDFERLARTIDVTLKPQSRDAGRRDDQLHRASRPAAAAAAQRRGARARQRPGPRARRHRRRRALRPPGPGRAILRCAGIHRPGPQRRGRQRLGRGGDARGLPRGGAPAPPAAHGRVRGICRRRDRPAWLGPLRVSPGRSDRSHRRDDQPRHGRPRPRPRDDGNGRPPVVDDRAAQRHAPPGPGSRSTTSRAAVTSRARRTTRRLPAGVCRRSRSSPDSIPTTTARPTTCRGSMRKAARKSPRLRFGWSPRSPRSPNQDQAACNLNSSRQRQWQMQMPRGLRH